MREDMIITPITTNERQELINMNMQDDIVVLYRTNKSNDIQIGMLAESIRKYFPKLANLDKINEAYDLAYFVGNGKSVNINIYDRPVYLIKPTDNRTVGEYQLLNVDIDKSHNIWLEDILEGDYKPQEESYSFRNIM